MGFEQFEDASVFVIPGIGMDKAVALQRIAGQFEIILAQFDQALIEAHRILEQHVVVDHAVGDQQAAFEAVGGSSCGVLRMFAVYSWLYEVQSVTGRNAAPAENTSGARNMAMSDMKPP